MSFATMIEQACYLLTIPKPADGLFFTGTNVTARRLEALANEEGRQLAGRHNWQAMLQEKTFTTSAAAAQSNSVSSDFDRMIPETMFNRTTQKRVLGPVSSDEWQTLQSGVNTLINPVFRIRLGTIYMYPTPTAGQTVAYEYVSKNWCEASGGTDQSAWATIGDLGLLDETLMTLGIVWRFKKSAGMDWEGDRAEYEARVRNAIIRDGSRPRLSSDRASADRVPFAPQIPEGSWDI